MTDDVVVRAEGLGKKYVIGHQAERGRYTALRDVIARSAKGIARSTLDMVRGRPIAAGDRTEEFWALKDVNFEIKRGEVVGIIGRNGAGKSTLLKVLSRITEPSEGRVEIRGRVASLLEVGTGFHPELTGRENIFLNGAILGMRRAEIKSKFDEIVAFAEVERFLDTPVKRYSSGMYVRLAFSVAAHLEPEILVVDEVLAVGDAEFQKKCLGKMQDVAGHGRTVLFVTHNMAALQTLCSRGIILNQGQIVGSGPAAGVVSEYLALTRSPGANDDRVLSVSEDLSITKFKPNYRSIISGRPIVVDIVFSAGKPVRIEQLALLIYSSSQLRVAIVDMRSILPAQVEANSDLAIACKIDNFSMVEGSYNLGLHIVSSEFIGDFDDLCTLDVESLILKDGVVPYAAQYRGVVELASSVKIRNAT